MNQPLSKIYYIIYKQFLFSALQENRLYVLYNFISYSYMNDNILICLLYNYIFVNKKYINMPKTLLLHFRRTGYMYYNNKKITIMIIILVALYFTVCVLILKSIMSNIRVTVRFGVST